MRKTLSPLTPLPRVNSTGAGGAEGLTLGEAESRGLALGEGTRLPWARSSSGYGGLSLAIHLRTGRRRGARRRRRPGQPRSASPCRVSAAAVPARPPRRSGAPLPDRTRRYCSPARPLQLAPVRAPKRRFRVRGANPREPRAAGRAIPRALLESAGAR